MTSQKQDGGAAFPLMVPTEFQFANPGMSLRDYFAGQSLAGLLLYYGNSGEISTANCDIAEWSYAMADAMLAERAKASSQEVER